MVILRDATVADAEAIAALVRLAFAHLSAAVDPPPSALRESGDSIAAILLNGGGGAVIEDAGRMVGAAIWYGKEDGLYFGRLSVHPEARGRGIARRLVAAAEAAARAGGLPKLLLSTRLALTDNRRLFAAAGFVETAQHAHPGYAAPTFVDMEKALG
jgi:N-acetylglutamate synthase-like GNAT family acetyltransferase